MQDYSFTVFDSHEITQGKIFPLERGKTIFNNFALQHIQSYSKCGGKAVCGRCRVKILTGQEHCNKPVAEEKIILNPELLEQGWRLACQLYSLKDISIYTPTDEEISAVVHPSV